MFCLALEFDFNDWLAALVDNLEWEMLHVSLNLSVGELPANQSLGVEDGVGRVHGDLVLCSITNETLGVCEGDKGRCCSVALVVGNDFDAVISKDAYARVGRTQIDTYGRSVSTLRLRLWLRCRLTNGWCHVVWRL
jgi:hypothetical protein